MKIKLYDFILSFKDLLTGRAELVYELTFLLGVINFTIGLVVTFTALGHWHLLAGMLICLSGLVGIITAIVPYPKIRAVVDTICAATILYGGIELINNGGLRQMSIALLIIYGFLYLWKWFIEGVNRGIIDKTSH